MKKMIAAIVVVACAVIANAASVNWAVTGGTSSQVGYTAYLVTSIDSDWTSASDVASAAAALGTGTSGVIAKSGRNYAFGPAAASGSGITADSMSDAYIVFVTSADAKEYTYISANMSANVFGDSDPAGATFSTTTAALLAGQSGSFGSVPEPTSGLLLLLGMAGLALRRKQK